MGDKVKGIVKKATTIGKRLTGVDVLEQAAKGNFGGAVRAASGVDAIKAGVKLTGDVPSAALKGLDEGFQGVTGIKAQTRALQREGDIAAKAAKDAATLQENLSAQDRAEVTKGKVITGSRKRRKGGSGSSSGSLSGLSASGKTGIQK